MNLTLIAVLILAVLAVIGSHVIAKAKANQAPWLQPNLLSAANSADGPLGVHDKSIRRTVDSALTVRHLLVKQGASANSADICGAADIPLGAVDNILAVGEPATVLLLGKEETKLLIASGPINAGVEVFTDAGGKVQARPTGAGTYYYIGISLTAATADGDVIEVSDNNPVKLVIAGGA